VRFAGWDILPSRTDVVAPTGNSYHGTNDQKVFDLEGNLVVEVPGTSTATRISH